MRRQPLFKAMSYDDDAMEEAPIFTLPPEIKFEGEPGAILKLKLVERGDDGSLKVSIMDEEPAEDEDLKTTLRRDMAAISEEGEM